ncbi:MAG: DNA repair protein RecO [Candidatus Limiplasma sp.]|nr:DNA repair protein RecO [Candidatus Limiplasma sp.]MEA5146140.1 DNA repair protein RecO [Candidatus Limiplasma sp.]
MPSETMQAVVLRHANYRDRDRMLSLLTPDHGLVDVLSRGCRRPKSPLMAGSELFVHEEVVLYRSGERYTLTACSVTDSFYPLRTDPYRLTCGTYMLGLCHAAAQPEQAAEGLFSLLLKSLYHLTYCVDEAAITVTNAFLLLFATEIGYRPRLNHCVRCRKPLPKEQRAWLDIEAGGLCCQDCSAEHQFVLSHAQVNWMRSVLGSGFEAPLSTPDDSLFEALRRYVESRMETTVKASKLLP